MANARIAVGSILSTVSDTANAVSGIVNTVSNSLDMANAFVRHQQEKQRFDQKVDLYLHQERKLEEISLETAERKKKIEDHCKDPALEKYYNETFSKLQSIVNPQAAKAA
ncbi:hypothetical protein ACQKO5_19195 [Novosphingobium subterraneum]|uniref:hypothetical protein n=1 Tax=Novosphingobium subterraneum TaxID=48936 RepID=UPI003D05AF63